MWLLWGPQGLILTVPTKELWAESDETGVVNQDHRTKHASRQSMVRPLLRRLGSRAAGARNLLQTGYLGAGKGLIRSHSVL